MGVANSVLHVSAVDLILLASAGWFLLVAGLFLSRWLSKAAGHPIGQNPTVKILP